MMSGASVFAPAAAAAGVAAAGVAAAARAADSKLRILASLEVSVSAMTYVRG